MIYNYIKCESVIAKIMADLDSQETRNRVTDIREWIFEAIEKIGAPMQYIDKETDPIRIEDGQIPIPQDMNSLQGVAYSISENGPYIRVLKNTGTFKNHRICNNIDKCVQTYDEANYTVDEHYQRFLNHQPMRYKLPSTQSQLILNDSRVLEDVYKHHNLLQDVEYFIKPGWIVLNRHKGYVKLAYKAIAVDERGYPLIPDLQSYQEAIYWYVIMKLSFSKYMNGKLGGKGVNNAQNVYFYIQGQWNFYKNQAYGEAMMPNQDDMKNIKNEWNQLISDYNADEKFFKDINKRQSFYTDYYYGR